MTSVNDKNNFASLAKNKLDFLNILCHDKSIAQCLICEESDFKKYNPTETEMEKLKFSQIFPHFYIPNIQESTKSFISMKTIYRPNIEKICKTGYITFYIYCHKSLVQTKYLILRYDYLLTRIDTLLSGLRSINNGWMGRLEFAGMDDLTVGNSADFVGVSVTYKNLEVL